MDVLSCARDSCATKDFTLAVPTKWLEAWLSCFVTQEEILGSADSEVLVSCLMVRITAAPDTRPVDDRFIEYHVLTFSNP
jgi:hypothetical protein